MKADRSRPQRGRPPTLRDVAAYADVSMMTVSNVINERTARVSEQTRVRILAAIDKLGYRPQRSARGLRMQREYAIGLTIVRPDRRFLDDPYVTEVAAGMSNRLAAAGYGLMVNGVTDVDGLKALLTHASNVDGLAVMASGPRPGREEVYRLLERLHHPLAIIQDDMAGLADTCCFIQDDETGARMITEQVIAAGARTLFFAAPDHLWPAVERREAGVRAAARRRAKVMRIGCNEADFQGSIATILAAFERRGVPDAVVGANDQIGIAAIHAAMQRGLVVPDDLMVTGFNAFPFRQFSGPLISSMRSPAYALGEAAAVGLLSRIDGEGFETTKQVLPVVPAEGVTIRMCRETL
ncbi:MAG: LacI family DNA-binding transcriptional regulator [Bauldia sp.]|nr:LacI family DNA-binding transcriptional regulator [Bauldia sp.]